jgi:hypothetical protein
MHQTSSNHTPYSSISAATENGQLASPRAGNEYCKLASLLWQYFELALSTPKYVLQHIPG